MNTRGVNALAGVIGAAMQTRQTAAGIAMAIESAGMYQSPETAQELVRLRDERHSTNESVDEASRALHEKDARIAELEQQRDRRRGRLVALQNDRMEMQGLLSPNDGTPRRVPPEIEIDERVAPAVEWLVGRVAELEQQLATARAVRDVEIIAWLGKKAREYRSLTGPRRQAQADAVDAMASKIARGAVRPVDGGAR